MTNDIGFLIKIIKKNMDCYFNQLLKSADLTASQVQILNFLRDRGETRTTQKDIEKYLQVSHPTVVGILQRLENKGFVRTEFDGTDKRKKYVYLTQKEADFYDQMRNSHDNFENLLIQGMTKEQTEELRNLLMQVYENIKE